MYDLSDDLELEATARVPPVYITKYNRYVDSILERVNKVLRVGYDPVNVRLHTVKKAPAKKDDKNKNKTQKKKGNKGKNKKKKNKNNKKKIQNKRERQQAEAIVRAITEALAEVNATETTTEYEVDVTTVEPTTIIQTTSEDTAKVNRTSTVLPETTGKKQGGGSVPRVKPKNKNKKKQGGKTKVGNGGKQNQKPRAKATLYGLATLKRVEDVSVNLMSTHNTIRSKFSIGPLTLKVEKEFGRGAKKELRSATATTTEMIGKLNLRVLHGGSATLHSIRVMQPNLLRVDSLDDHDKTREFVWRRSSHIAQIVSQKLTKATRSMLQPPPPKPTKKQPNSGGSVFSYFL